jgi:hypothetical protein
LVERIERIRSHAQEHNMAFQHSNETLDRNPALSMVISDADWPGTGPIGSKWDCDPLDPDASDDVAVATTSRRLIRVAIAAADAGARFAREGREQDPAAWMLTPRDLFDGLPPIDACQELRHFARSVVLHAVGLDLDADPEVVDALLLDEDDDADDAGVSDAVDGGSASTDAVGERLTDPDPDAATALLARPELLTCWVDCMDGGSRVFAFCAMVTDRPADLVERVVGRFGLAAASTATFACGFDHTTAQATAMISDAMADTLELAAADPASPLAAGLDVVVEQRFVDWKLAA